MIDHLISLTKTLAQDVSNIQISREDLTVYNPLEYAWEPHERYLRAFAADRKRVVFLGMNPGPWGMAQTGVPFGDLEMVRDWMGITGRVDKPQHEHPSRPVTGFETSRSEVSGSRLWGYMRQRFGDAKSFFADNLVLNYCPLIFMEPGGKNFTPDKLPKDDRIALEHLCDDYLAAVTKLLQPEYLVGVGKYAQKKYSQVLSQMPDGDFPSGRPQLGWVLHPSPASPAANRGWAEAAEKQLADQGIWN
jgi:single-strand selective monofunctional uracil DNA glycosylase